MMGVDPKWGRFPICPEINVPFCPRLSSFVLFGAQNGDKLGQARTNGDKTGHFGTNWETPPFRIHPHVALLKQGKLALRISGLIGNASDCDGVPRGPCAQKNTLG